MSTLPVSPEQPEPDRPVGRQGGAVQKVRWSAPWSAAAAVLLLLVASCSSGDDGARVPVTAPTPTAEAGEEVGGEVGGDVGDPAGDDATVTTDEPATGEEIEEVPAPTLPEIGVPGLDAEEVVCRAWSRFAGSFQVAAVAASFGDDPIDAAVLEIAASPVVTAAAAEMIDAWPDELAEEADEVAERYLGPFARRAGRALERLVDAGADDAQLERLSQAWVDALAQRDPAEVLPDLILDADLADLVEAAALRFAAEVPPIPSDPSLITDVEIPLTQEFLFETCPDRGTLAGGDAVD